MLVQKRQIYREQVLPHAGGKIPDTAFDPDRLFLNRLQKEGIAVPDGRMLQPRLPKVNLLVSKGYVSIFNLKEPTIQVYPLPNRSHRKVLRISATADGRFVPIDEVYGDYSAYRPNGDIETTYLHPQMNDHATVKNTKHYFFPNRDSQAMNVISFQGYKVSDKRKLNFILVKFFR